MKKTVIIGATTNPSRYAYIAAEMFAKNNIPFEPVGIKKGIVFGKEILNLNEKPIIEDVDTITLYIGSRHQPEWYDYFLSLKPKRIIFNPGTENAELINLAKENNIEATIACTLVLISSNQY
ncbi:CoA-binding protein [Belliella aquatica]|uniref:CoA-binding protein n=1 Tax=Belliella aquatica TaxID=1323734 RepID=A0ABQ1LUE9_9BACT|nr:CoA-binding protein [Belliella aquatica]MCH7405857.1 CoA-binding protein [Belliella aquatica]GGC30176.1 CoA-binding protein [Belliella aquatica]